MLPANLAVTGIHRDDITINTMHHHRTTVVLGNTQHLAADRSTPADTAILFIQRYHFGITAKEQHILTLTGAGIDRGIQLNLPLAFSIVNGVGRHLAFLAGKKYPLPIDQRIKLDILTTTALA